MNLYLYNMKLSMLIIPLFIANFTLGFGLNRARVCSNAETYPFTGYKIENRIKMKTWRNEFHLVYCNDNKIIYDLKLNETIPWTKQVHFENKKVKNTSNRFILSRVEQFALRSIPLYLPQTVVGAIHFITDDEIAHVTMLIAESILDNWLEINYRLELLLHIPILSTPAIDSKEYGLSTYDGSVSILANESYSYTRESQNRVSVGVDKVLSKIDSLISDFSNKPDMLFMFHNLVSLSKLVPTIQFKRILDGLDMMMRY